VFFINLWFIYAARATGMAAVMTAATRRLDLTAQTLPVLAAFALIAFVTSNPADQVPGRLTPDLSAGYGKTAAKIHAITLVAVVAMLWPLHSLAMVVSEQHILEFAFYGVLPSLTFLTALIVQSFIDDARVDAVRAAAAKTATSMAATSTIAFEPIVQSDARP
jgi:hypothetical protein